MEGKVLGETPWASAVGRMSVIISYWQHKPPQVKRLMRCEDGSFPAYVTSFVSPEPAGNGGWDLSAHLRGFM